MESTYNSAEEYLNSLPDDTDRNFSKIITQHCSSPDTHFVNAIEKVLEDASDSEIQGNTAYYFAAFYSLVVYHRHKGNYTCLADLLKKYDYHFEDRPLFIFSKSSLLSSGNEEHALRYALDLAQDCLAIIKYPSPLP